MTAPPARLSHTGRVEAFSDGVMAIAITLLILDVRVPAGAGSLLTRLLRIWPSYLAYLASFLTIGIIWLNHHAFFTRLHHIDEPLQWANLMLLLCVSILPFPTQVLAEHVRAAGWDGRVAAALYGLVGAAMTAPWVAMWTRLVHRPELFEPGHDAAFARRERVRASAGVGVYALCVLVALAVPVVALVLYVAVAVFYAVTSQGLAARDRAAGSEEG